MDDALELLDLIGEILDEIREGRTDVTSEVRRRYNKLVNTYQRRLWRRRLKPIVQQIDDVEWLDEAEAIIDLLRLSLRIFGDKATVEGDSQKKAALRAAMGAMKGLLSED